MDRRRTDEAHRTAQAAGLDAKRRFGGGVGRKLGIAFVVLAVLVAAVVYGGRAIASEPGAFRSAPLDHPRRDE